jgi:hypothetical protein
LRRRLGALSRICEVGEFGLFGEWKVKMVVG